MSFSKRQGYDAVCYTKPLDSLKGWNDHFFWVDAFACPASFPWHTSKSVSNDPFLKYSEFNANHYATLVAYPALFHKYPEPLLCLVGMSRNYTLDENTYPEFLRDNDEKIDLLSFIRTVDPTKVRIGEKQRTKGEPKLLDITVGHVVPLLPVAPSRTEGELEASVDKLFDKEGSGNQTKQGDSATGGEGADIQLPSHPAKKLKEDHGTPSLTSVAGKSMLVVQRLIVGAVRNAKVRGDPIPTLLFVTSSMSATPKREGGRHTDSLAGANLQTVSVPQRFVISSDSSHHSGTHVAETEVDSLIRSSAPAMTTVTTVTTTVDATTVDKEAPVKPSLFVAGSSSAGGTDPTQGGFSDLTGSDFFVGGIRTVIDPDFNLQKVYVPQWSVTNGSRLDDGRICREMVDEFAPPKFFASIRGIEHDQIFTKFNVGAARQIYLSAEAELLKVREKEIEDLKTQLLLKEAEAAEVIRLRAEASKFEVVEKSLRDEAQVLKERIITLESEKGELEVKVADLATSGKVREQEVADLDVVVTSVRSQNDNLVDQVHGLETSSTKLQEKVTVYENCMGHLERFQNEQIKVVNDKFDKLYTDFVEMALHLEEKFYPHLLTTISGCRWLLTHGMELCIAKCLNSTEYLSTLGVAIGKAAEKGMQDGLTAGITHGAEGRVLTDLKINKDASIKTIMNLLRLEDTLAEKLGLTELQPHVDQLMVPILHSLDQRVIGASTLSLSLDVSSSRFRKIKENIANHRSALRDVFVPLSEPLFVTALTSTKGTSNVISTTVDTTTALSVTFASVSSIPPISTDDYEVVRADGREGAGADANPFPNVDEAELNIS
ncbi:hypothetical protein Tco_1098613 [Tanacetum coccineum]